MSDGHKLWIPRPLPVLNEIIEARAKSKTFKSGKRWDAYMDMKKEWGQYIAIHARQQEFPKLDGLHEFFFEFRELDRRRDPDGFVSGATKIVFDALQDGGFMDNDGWFNVAGIASAWIVDKEHPGVMITAKATTYG